MTDSNPYAPPKSLGELEPSAEFRSNLLSRAFLRILRGREQPARFDQDSGEHEMFQSVWLRGIAPVLIYPTPAILIIAVLVHSPWHINWAIGVAIAIIGLGILFRLTTESVYFTEKYIRRFGPFRRRVQIPWNEVAMAEVGLGSELIFRDGGKRRITVHSDLHGHADLFAMMSRCLPTEAMKISNASLLELARHFHCNTAEFSPFLDRPANHEGDA